MPASGAHRRAGSRLGGDAARRRGAVGRTGWSVVLLVLASLTPLNALGAAARGSDEPLATASAASAQLDIILDSTQHWIGVNDVLFTAFDMTGARLADRDVPLLVELVSPSGRSILARPAMERFASYGRRIYRVRVPLDEVGRWQVRVASEDDGLPSEGRTVLDVWPDESTPALGSLVPSARTPTMRDARSMLHRISSDPEPLSAFYTWSLDEALAEGQPTALILDSYAYRPNAACGGALNILHEVFIDYPGLVVIHAEPWHMAPDDDGMLQLDPPEGPPVLTDVATAWGVNEPPWVFVIDKDGRLHAKFSGVVGSDELRAAIASVTPWRPGS